MKFCSDCGDQMPPKSDGHLCESCQKNSRSHRKGKVKRKERRDEEPSTQRFKR